MQRVFFVASFTPPDPADPAPYLKNNTPPAFSFRPIIDLRRYQVYEKENTEP
jgi:hypothetical protein